MPTARKATFIALLHLLCGHNALNLTVTTVYLLAAVTFMSVSYTHLTLPTIYSV